MELKIGCMLRAGLDLDDAARYYRVFADVILGYTAMDASLAALDAPLRRADLLAWSTDYSSLPFRSTPTSTPSPGVSPRWMTRRTTGRQLSPSSTLYGSGLSRPGALGLAAPGADDALQEGESCLCLLCR